jgi:hypothetical protein
MLPTKGLYSCVPNEAIKIILRPSAPANARDEVALAMSVAYRHGDSHFYR